MLAAIVMVLLLFCVVYLQARNKKKLEQSNQTITLNKKLIETKNKELTDSLNYAQRVQNSLLPREEKTKKLLNDHFILFLPRDIVSGDFYWIAPMKLEHILQLQTAQDMACLAQWLVPYAITL